MYGLGFRIKGLGFKDSGLEIRVKGLGIIRASHQKKQNTGNRGQHRLSCANFSHS